MQFPSVCPEIPVADLATALAYYRDQLGFTIDWADNGNDGLAGLSRGDTRAFMTTPASRSYQEFQAPIVLWLNLSSRAEIDALHNEWLTAGAIIAAPPEAKPYKLYEFFPKDVDGNFFRVFYDFSWEERAGETR
jgi:predicted lactoylglutathione lyase